MSSISFRLDLRVKIYDDVKNFRNPFESHDRDKKKSKIIRRSYLFEISKPENSTP